MYISDAPKYIKDPLLIFRHFNYNFATYSLYSKKYITLFHHTIRNVTSICNCAVLFIIT